MMMDCINEIRKICLAFTDEKLKRTFVLCLMSQLRSEGGTKDQEKEMLRKIADDH